MSGRMVWDGVRKKWVMSDAQKAMQFRPGETPNPLGRDSATNAQLTLNGKKASTLRAELLDALESKIMSIKVNTEPDHDEVIPEGGMPREAAQRISALLSPDVNRMLADSEDRAWGKPTQPSRDDTPPKKDIRNDMTPQEAAEAYQAEISGGQKK